MSDNDLSSKLAKGMRRAKEPSPTSASPTDAAANAASAQSVPAAAPVAASTVASQVHKSADRAANQAARQRAENPGAESGSRFAEQGDQAPPASLDRPWDNLHPKRIWPD